MCVKNIHFDIRSCKRVKTFFMESSILLKVTLLNNWLPLRVYLQPKLVVIEIWFCGEFLSLIFNILLWQWSSKEQSNLSIIIIIIVYCCTQTPFNLVIDILKCIYYNTSNYVQWVNFDVHKRMGIKIFDETFLGNKFPFGVTQTCRFERFIRFTQGVRHFLP